MSRRGFVSLKAGVEYLEIPKVACTSIKFALLRTDGLEAIDGNHAHSHRHWESIPDEFKPTLVFSFVRHPFDRLISSYVEKLKTGSAKQLCGCPLPFDASFEEWVRWVVSNRPDRHWAPQSSIMDRRRAKPDVVYRFEKLAPTWEILQSHFGLADLPHENKSREPDDDTHFWHDAETVRLAREFYREDFERFGYE